MRGGGGHMTDVGIPLVPSLGTSWNPFYYVSLTDSTPFFSQADMSKLNYEEGKDIELSNLK